MEHSSRVIADVREKIRLLKLSEAEAARVIGVTAAALNRHLGGEYVRSDSLAKYRKWLIGSANGAATKSPTADALNVPMAAKECAEPLLGPKSTPASPHRIVDLFGGCGGLSLGFELAGGGGLFRTALAIDIEEPMVRVFNANHPCAADGSEVGRQADLSEFLNEAEVLAYYLDHLASVEADRALKIELDSIEPAGLASLVFTIRQLDRAFFEELERIRVSRNYQGVYGAVPKPSLTQTSVMGFHKALKLPQPGVSAASFEPLLWGGVDRGNSSRSVKGMVAPDAIKLECHAEAEALWALEIKKLRDRSKGAGAGQLASAAKKIKDSLKLLESTAYAEVRAAWVDWRAQRDGVRRYFFENDKVLERLRAIYQKGRQVDVLLGGPPCQGFSRIGRGKIRSLREQSVHVQSDAKAGDKRNELMLQYVLFVAALAPSTFLFENVRHFQAEVKTQEGTFNATELLAEAISSITWDGLQYEINSKILVASDHLVPQARERFFMVGVRQDVAVASGGSAPASWCLSLPHREPVPLKIALAGLPDPVCIGGTSGRAGGTDTLLPVEDLHVHGNGPVGAYLEWIRQPPPADRPNHSHRRIDAHCARDSRPDDRAFFAMIGPGKRWMDYRCDGSSVVNDLAKLIAWAMRAGKKIDGLGPDRLQELLDAMDGSLPLRLLLDQIPLAPGEIQHHLCSANYLKKREGSHGDWLARLDAELPSKTMVSHMGKDTYAYIHPSAPRTISVREAARVQTFPDWYSFGSVGLVDGYRVIGNAVPPLLSSQLALRVSVILEAAVGKLASVQHSALRKVEVRPQVRVGLG